MMILASISLKILTYPSEVAALLSWSITAGLLLSGVLHRSLRCWLADPAPSCYCFKGKLWESDEKMLL